MAADPAALEQISASLHLSADDLKQEMTALMQKLQEQAEEIMSRQDRGPTRFIRHLGVRSLWREYCGPCECCVGRGPLLGVDLPFTR